MQTFSKFFFRSLALWNLIIKNTGKRDIKTEAIREQVVIEKMLFSRQG